MIVEGLYAIVDPAQVLAGRKLKELVCDIISGGAKAIQLRDKESGDGEVYERAKWMAKICQAEGVPFIVNNRVDIAQAVGADGVHVGPEDLPVDVIRQMVGPEFILGGSAGSVERAEMLEKAGADYLGVGAVFEARVSKSDASTPRGLGVIEEVSSRVGIPVVGIGGIEESNAADVIAAGASAIAVIRALCAAEKPEEAARRLNLAIDQGRALRRTR